VLRIRDEQLATLREPRHDEIAERLVAHVRRHFPDETRRYDDIRLQSLVRAGVRRCDGYGITIARDVCRFVNLMCAFGWDFDTRLPWAQRVLHRSAGRDRRPKIERLYEAALEHASP
jgi:hypothetical protein